MGSLTVTRVLVAIGFTAVIVLQGSPVVSGRQSVHRSGPAAPLAPLTNEDEQRRAAEQLTVKMCSDCHQVAAVTTKRRTARDWQDLVQAMASRGPEATAAELATISQFLTRTRGIVAVNTAPAADFVAVLGLSSEVANAVVAHRTIRGKFADLDALLQVPGLDRSSLERDVQALWFD
jgi:DNA uptake protein ComE-like DNA-binding protein